MKINNILKSFSIRARIILIFVVLISITLTTLGVVIFSSWIRSADEVTLENSKRSNEEASLDVQGFLDNPLELNRLHEDLISHGYVDMRDEVERERFFVLSLENYDPQVYSFSFGSVNGEYYGARRNEDGVVEIMRNNEETGGYSWYYSVNDDFTANERVVIAGEFDPRTRPWYTAAAESGGTVFSSVYEHFIMEDLTVSLATPIYDAEGIFQGVLGTHMVLSGIDLFLEQILEKSDGAGVIFNQDNKELIANSIGLANYTILEDGSIERPMVDTLSDRGFDRAYRHYIEYQDKSFELNVDGKSHYYTISEIHEEGVDWLIITSVPQGQLYENIMRNIYLMVVIFVLSVLMMIAVYQLFIKKVFQPIDDLVDVSKNYAKGDFSKRAHISGNHEFSKLADAYHAMAENIEGMVNNLEETVHDRTENLRIVNHALTESEQRFKILHNASFGGIALHDQGHILDCNQGLSDITGFSMDELLGMDGLLLIAPDYRDYVMDHIKSGYEKSYEAFGIRKNGEFYPLRLEARNIPYLEKKARVVEFRDITEIKEQEKERKKSEKGYHLLYETMSQGVVYQDYEGRITSCNPAAEHILGLSLSQMQEKTSMDPHWKMVDEEMRFVPGEEHPTMIALKEKKTVGPVIRGVYQSKKDSYVWLNIIAIPLFIEGEEKPYRVYATIEDITEKRNAHFKLKERNAMIEGLFNNMNTGIAIYQVIRDGRKGEDYIIRDFNDISLIWEGRKREEVVGKAIVELHPNIEKSGILDVFRTVWKTGEGTTFPVKQFINGNYNRWHENTIFKLPTGEIVAMYDDVTKRIESQKQLEESRDMMQRVMDNLPIGIAVNAVDPKIRFEYMNDLFPKIYGTTREILMTPGTFFEAVYHNEETRERIRKRMEDDVKNKGSESFEWSNIPLERDNLETRYVSAYGTRIPNSNLMISMVMDVTKQQERESEILHISNYDYLTDIPNRRYFSENLKDMDLPSNYPLGILMLDINGLKLFNDSFGYEYGDVAIKHVAKVIGKSVREEDVFARLGGDEFGIIVPNTTEEALVILQEKIDDVISEFSIENVTISLASGHAIKFDESEKTDAIIKKAEENMYKQKVLEGRSMRSLAIHTMLATLTDKFNVEKIHSQRVSAYCYKFGKVMNLSKEFTQELKLAGLLHDIGKISIPDHILNKPGKLDADEWEIMKKHTIYGYNILRAADEYSNLALYALTHHERYDGTGYPKGLSKDDIPLFSRVISVIDAYEAMTADRPYRKALGEDQAILELIRCKHTQFDPKIVDVFIDDVLEYARS